MWFDATGTAQYFGQGTPEAPYKAWVLIDPELQTYYRSLVPLHYGVRPQRYPAHISFVRKIPPKNLDVWGKHEGRQVRFRYETWHYNDDRYWWLNVLSPDIEQIREELGMPAVGPTTWSPDGVHRFHTTLGNTKENV